MQQTPEYQEPEVTDHNVEYLLAAKHTGKPEMVRRPSYIETARLSRLYDGQVSPDAWQRCADGYATGSITTTSTTATAQVTMNLNRIPRLKQFPDAVQYFLVIHLFSIAPTLPAGITTASSLAYTYTDQSGAIVPLGIGFNTSSYSTTHPVLIPVSLSDEGNKSIGSITAVMGDATGTTGTYTYQMRFSFAYLLPDIAGYQIERRKTSEEMIHETHHN